MRVAVVSGVARRAGIGRAVCRQLLSSRWRVIGCDFAAEEPHEHESSPNYSFLRVDIRRAEDVRALAAHVEAVAGGASLHLLVNNAGLSSATLSAVDPGDPVAAFNAYIDTNLTGAFLMSHTLQPLLAPGASSIVHIASTRALQSEPGCEGYAAAKAGLLGLTHAQAASLAGRTRVNAVLPGWIDVTGGQEPITEEQHRWQWTGRVGQPDDVAHMVAFLADGALSGYVTGQQFVVDGGVTKRMHYPE
ncbi:hypothetical protein HYH03_007882 [Edaphochlamys debaryana]|uniref:Uncharacterized protein n=1 Tax=Edaphochlamys debaryana TaxID=47281 RepID=A0A835XZM3_9CHLO|nr:hypothetical protein HYH03_007882 [Edaphochlamys debaryana]|eukprot:KAG2493952.1 hypothetical protein HYH03_007882 [Edaphochlamys debaryana]